MAASANTTSTLSRFLEGEYIDLKRELRAHVDKNKLFNLRFDLPLNEHRQLTVKRAKYLFSTPQIRQQFQDEARGQRNFVNKSLAIGEVVSTTDLSVGVKMGVMGWLFAGAVKNLGSPEHMDRWFHPLGRLEFTGMFAMSELGHGSNVRGIETTAHFDASTQEFIINTPTPTAKKIYIGNALQGEYAAVFAQLKIENENKGPHCFIVPIRDTNGLKPGIEAVDLGPKEGLNGVDNGWLSFDNVRIPKCNFLNRYADVTAEGRYVTSIKSDGARFSATLGALLGTRLALCFQALAATKIGLEIAVKYSLQRRQFGPANKPEMLLLDYQTHQLRLMPKLATCLALIFATRHCGNLLNEDVDNKIPLIEDRPLQALAGGLKAYSTWEAVDTLQICRECTGGMGYMEENRLASLKRDSDVFVTFEGDNIVMLQQVAKNLLLQYSEQFGGSKLKAAILGAKESFISKLKTSFLAFTIDPITSVHFVQKALAFKEAQLLRTLAARLYNKVSSHREEPFDAWNHCLNHVTSLGMCHVQRVTLANFMRAIETCPQEQDKLIMKKFCALYAVHLLHNERAWLLEQGYLTSSMSKDIRDKYIQLCADTRVHALEVVEAFLHPSNCVHAPIAGIPNERAPWAFHPASSSKL